MKNIDKFIALIIKIDKRDNLYSILFSLIGVIPVMFFFIKDIKNIFPFIKEDQYIFITIFVITILFFTFKILIKELSVLGVFFKNKYDKKINISKLSKEANALYAHLKKEGKNKFNITEQQLKTTYCYYLEKNPQYINELSEIDNEIKRDDLETLKTLEKQLNVHKEENKKIHDFINTMNNHQDIKAPSKKNEYITKHEKSFKNAYRELKILNLIKIKKIDGENIIFLI